jgi:hypothetical protein
VIVGPCLAGRGHRPVVGVAAAADDEHEGGDSCMMEVPLSQEGRLYRMERCQ